MRPATSRAFDIRMKLTWSRVLSLVAVVVLFVIAFTKPEVEPLGGGVRWRRLPRPLGELLGLSFILSLIWYPEFYARMQSAFEYKRYSERADEMAFLFQIIGWMLLVGCPLIIWLVT